MKRIIYIIIAGFCWGMMFLFAKIVFQIPDGAIWQYYLILSAILLIGMAAFNIFYNLRYLKKMNAIAPLLDAGRPE